MRIWGGSSILASLFKLSLEIRKIIVAKTATKPNTIIKPDTNNNRRNFFCSRSAAGLNSDSISFSLIGSVMQINSNDENKILFRYEVTAEQQGQRIDSLLATLITNFSRTRIKSLIKFGEVTINECIITQQSKKVNTGDYIELNVPEPELPKPEPENLDLPIVFEDDDIIVVDKPSGMVVHPAPGNWSGTLVNALLYHCGDRLSGIQGVIRPGIVHRLDKDTGGLLVVAKNDTSHIHLSQQFADHGRNGALRRSYKALVWDSLAQDAGTIDLALSRSVKNRQKIAVNKKNGRFAITHWKVLERFGLKNHNPIATLVECQLETGRTHQIRVHLAHIGHPLIGDAVYGSHFNTKISKLPKDIQVLFSSFSRQALHADLLEFLHPNSKQNLKFNSPLPKDFEKLLNSLRKI